MRPPRIRRPRRPSFPSATRWNATSGRVAVSIFRERVPSRTRLTSLLHLLVFSKRGAGGLRFGLSLADFDSSLGENSSARFQPRPGISLEAAAKPVIGATLTSGGSSSPLLDVNVVGEAEFMDDIARRSGRSTFDISYASSILKQHCGGARG